MESVVIIGYSGHAYVICDILESSKIKVLGYCENTEKAQNPFKLSYLGLEQEEKTLSILRKNACFVAIGDNFSRRKVQEFLIGQHCKIINIIDGSSRVSSSSTIENGVMIGPGAIVNALCKIQQGAICNSGSIVEHECIIGKFTHIAPGAVLCGNVQVGENSFIGAGAIIKQNINIGSNVIVGAGTVVVKDIPSNSTVIGNPQKFI